MPEPYCTNLNCLAWGEGDSHPADCVLEQDDEPEQQELSLAERLLSAFSIVGVIAFITAGPELACATRGVCS